MKYVKASPICYSSVKRKRSNVKYIVIHNTGNKNDKAISNAKFYQHPPREAGAHFFIDREGNIVKSIGMDRTAWSVGGSLWNDCKKTGGGKLHNIVTNSNSVSIELCDIVDKYPSQTQIKAVKKCIRYIRRYCRDAKTVVTHFSVTGKHCPIIMMNSSTWNQFLSDIGEK